MNYDDDDKEERIKLSGQKNHGNDGTSRVGISGSAVFTRQQKYV
jgi:hypothetical protein